MTLSSALSGPKKNDITISKYYSYVSSLLCGDTHEWRPDLDEQAFIADRDGTAGAVNRRQVMLIALGAGILLAGLIVGLLRVRAG